MRASEIVDKVRELAAASPDCVYRGLPGGGQCSYVDGECSNGSRGCIVGQAMRLLGHKFKLEHRRLDVRNLLEELRIVSGGLLNWLENVQYQQDFGDTWGNAVAFADDHN